jgi:hypothetical protein
VSDLIVYGLGVLTPPAIYGLFLLAVTLVLYLERGADPIRGKPLGPDFAVYGPGETNLTNIRISGAS